jgi:hypothetical protein
MSPYGLFDILTPHIKLPRWIYPFKVVYFLLVFVVVAIYAVPTGYARKIFKSY